MSKSDNSPHVSDVELVQFADGEMATASVTAVETHLRTCQKCRTRSDQLKSGADAYDQYHAHLLKPNLDVAQEWPSMRSRLDASEQPRYLFFAPLEMWWAAAALACCALAIGWFMYRDTPTRHMQRMLARASVVHTPAHRRLQVTANGHSWYRAATLQVANERGLDTTGALFVKANYSWSDPLSAHSFAAWRKQLSHKRDQVLSIRGSGGSYYRLQTKTPTGVLRMATLTLRADTLNPVKGAFHFEGQNDVTISDAGEMPDVPKQVEAENKPVSRPEVVKEVGPEEELRVFAALDTIGADVGEPLTVDIDPSKRHISVVGVGLSADREQQIRQALALLPDTSVRFTSVKSAGVAGQPANASEYTTGDAAPLRHEMEMQAGGTQQFQLLTDKALDSSSSILTQANALYVLGQKFPPAVASDLGPSEQETLRALRSRHATAVQQGLSELKIVLVALLNPAIHATDETQSQQATSWDVGAAQLFEQAKLLDASLGRILAGSYSQETGQAIRNRLPQRIREMEALARAQENVQ